MFKKFFIFGFVFSFFLFGCTDSLDTLKNNEKYGSVSFSSDIRKIAVSEIATAKVSVVYGEGSEDVVYASDSGNVTNGAGSTTVNNIPAGKNRIVVVEAQKSDGNKITDYVMTFVTDINADQTTPVNVTWSSSVKGNIYYSALKKGIDVASDSNIEKLDAIAKKFSDANIHASLIDCEKIATDFSSINASSLDVNSYKKKTATVKITAYGFRDKKIQISDPNSSISETISLTEQTVDIENVLNGTWNIYADGVFVKSVVITGTSQEVTIGTKIENYNGIQIQVAKSLGYDQIYYWSCSNAAYTKPTWPGIKLISDWCDEDYIYNFDDATSVNLLITNSSGDKLCETDIKITKAGSYRITSSGATNSEYISDVSDVPMPPVYTLPAKAYLGETFAIKVVSASPLSVATVTINGVTKNLNVGEKLFNVSDFTTTESTLNVSGTLTNEAGSVSISGSIQVVVRPSFEGPKEWNELRIYQVMVSSFQDGDPSIGYSYAYGPSGALTGGDLQGIINALDYIKSLGCNALWMTPIFDSTMSTNTYLNSTGYFCSDYFNIDPNFGTNQKFSELVEAAHEKGIAVILDGVYGHWGDAGVKASPTGKTPTRSHGQYKACDYPASLPFFQEVAEYWIKNYKIDGWRFDQCYQVAFGENAKGDGDNCYTNGYNYWYDIRRTIESAASNNGDFGTAWGTLGYTVGEHWRGDAATIQAGTVAPGNAPGYGLRSCFDFPARYKIVQSLAVEESKNEKDVTMGEAVSYSLSTSSAKGYTHPEGYTPNLFFTNHDLVRFGNLLNWKYNISPSTGDKYWGLHKVAIAILASYSGPITIYYGDEWGAYVDGYTGPGALGAHNDNMARSTGKISNFTTNEQSLVNYVSELMQWRASYPALWKGNVENLKSETDYYVGKKTLSGEKSIGIILNKGSSSVSYSFSGTDLETGTSFDGSCPAFSAKFVVLNN